MSEKVFVERDPAPAPADVPYLCAHCRQPLETPRSQPLNALRCIRCDFVQVAENAGLQAKELDSVSQGVSHPAWESLRLERYGILRPLSSNARVSVVLARHLHLDEPCVIKILHPATKSRVEESIEKLVSEARMGYNVNHPNVARVIDCDSTHGVWFYVAEYVPGVDLERLIDQFGPFPWRQVAEIGRQIAEGLGEIHRSGLIHRDLKPANVILHAGNRLKITDLGLAIVRARLKSDDTGDDRVSGTPMYMAPEQIASEGSLDERADLYGVGATLYHLLCGRPHRAGRSLLDLMQNPSEAAPGWPEVVAAQAPRWLCHAVEMCLAPKPEQRFRSASELADALSYELRADRSDIFGMQSPSYGRSLGVAALPFENLSQRSEDAWIGYALAEHIESRLLELGGVHVVDSRQFVTLLQRRGWPVGRTPPRNDALAVAQHIGANVIVYGSYERIGHELWLTAYALRPELDQPEHLARVFGSLDNALSLKEQLAEAVIRRLADVGETAPRGAIGRRGTLSLQANQKYISGKRAFANGLYDEAIQCGEEAIAIDPEYLETISFIGACYARLGRYDKALEYHTRHQLIARQHGDIYRLAEALSNIGAMYYYMGEYHLGLEFMERAAALESELRLLPVLAKNYNNMGFVLTRLNRLVDARAAFNRSIELNKGVGDLVSLISPYNGMGGVALRQSRPEEAREYYSRALVLANEVEDKVNIGVSHMNIGRCACLLSAFDEARRELSLALEVLEGTSYWNALAMAHQYLAEMYVMTNELGDAQTHAALGIELAERHKNRRLQVAGWEQKARATLRSGDRAAALQCLRQALELVGDLTKQRDLDSYLREVAGGSVIAADS